MRAGLIALSDLGPAEIGAWQELANRALSPNPFFEPGFVLPSARGLGVSDAGILRVSEGREWMAALPVRRVLAWRSVPGPSLAAWVHLYCFLGTPLVAGEDPHGAIATLVRRALRERACLALDLIDHDGPLADPISAALAGDCRLVTLEEFERAKLVRRPQPDYLEQTTSPRHRKEMRRTLRKLAAEVGELRVVDRSHETVAYDAFLEIEASGWKGRRGTALRCHEGHAAFFREMCERFAADGRLELLSLESERTIAAMKCNLRGGNGTFCFKIAFLDELAQFSPGIQLEVANIDHFHHGPSAWSDSCAVPFNAMINRLWPARRRLRSVVACRRGSAGALHYARWKGAATTVLPARKELARRLRKRASAN